MSDEDEIAALRSQFSVWATGQAADLRAYLEQRELNASKVERLAHILAGTAGMLGFSDVAAAAAPVNEQFAAGEMPTREALEALLASLESTPKTDA